MPDELENLELHERLAAIAKRLDLILDHLGIKRPDDDEEDDVTDYE